MAPPERSLTHMKCVFPRELIWMVTPATTATKKTTHTTLHHPSCKSIWGVPINFNNGLRASDVIWRAVTNTTSFPGSSLSIPRDSHGPVTNFGKQLPARGDSLLFTCAVLSVWALFKLAWRQRNGVIWRTLFSNTGVQKKSSHPLSFRKTKDADFPAIKYFTVSSICFAFAFFTV